MPRSPVPVITLEQAIGAQNAAATRARPRAPRRWLRITGIACLLLCIATVIGLMRLPDPEIPIPARIPSPTETTATVTAGARYRAGGLRRFLLGDGYRELWAQPIRAEVLNPSTFAGGLTPMRRGGGNQTRNLHLRGADGREYVFRSLEKDQRGTLGWLGRNTLGGIRQDQVGALHPAGAVIASALQDAAGIAHPAPRLGVLPSHPALGEYAVAFEGLLGSIEEYPRDGYTGASEVSGTEDMLEDVEKHPQHAVDASAYLRARLMDVYLGDWDRHEGQWRWALRETPDGARWTAIARDRDYALADYRGVIPWIARLVDPKIVRFDAEYRDLRGLLVSAHDLDQRFLCGLAPAAWEGAAAELRGRLTDAAIATAVRAAPAEYTGLRGASIQALLRARRDRLPRAARDYRRILHARSCVQ
ncbi:MAG TPA: hypothetical protein VF665_04940 [Longimicrobium sp.]|uniref:hypothetical protein n=1 Tax=Longimicrobium sp. TaxID=2029185 RepID=UPI002ED86B1F